MKKRVGIILMLVLGLGMSLWGQHPKIDSLLGVLEHSPPDSERVNTLNLLMWRYRSVDAKLAIDYGLEALKLADSLQYRKGRIRAHSNLAAVYMRTEIMAPAIDHAQQAIELNLNPTDTTLMAMNYNTLGLIHSQKGIYDQTIELLRKAEYYYAFSSDPLSTIAPRHNRAMTLSQMGNGEEALSIYFENLELIEEKKADNLLAPTLNNIGNTYLEMEEFEKSLEYLLPALEVKKEEGDLFRAGRTCNNIAMALIGLNRLEEASFYTEEAARYAKESNAVPMMVSNLEVRSQLAEKEGKYEEALAYFKDYHFKDDSISNISQEEGLNDMLALLNHQQQRTEIELLTTENRLHSAQNQKNNLWKYGLAAVLVLMIGLLIAALRVGAIRKKANQELARKNQLIEDQQHAILRQNEELAFQNRHLEDLNREKDGLIHVVAHDLKAPLNKTLGLLELIQMEGNLSTNQLKFVGMIQQVNADAGRLVRDLLDLNEAETQSDEDSRQDFDPAGSLEEVLRTYEGAAVKKDIQIEASIPEQRPLLEGRKDYFQRILDNLVSNAVKFSPKGSTVQVRLEEQNSHIVCSISDQGPGISKEDQKRMFGKFQKLSARPTGGESSNGLGLAIVKTLSEKINGRIELRSTIGKGSTFSLVLPISKENPVISN